MQTQRITRISKFLSLVLRHKPQEIGITLDEAGWVSVRELLDAMGRSKFPVSEAELNEVVDTCDKKRFAFSEDRQKIRASQGHSVAVELGYEPAVPPETLYHGTVDRFLNSIRKAGLIKGKRHHVHLSVDVPTAMKVGERRGDPILLKVSSGQMHRDGVPFFVSANGVWLTEHVPPEYIEVLQRDDRDRLIRAARVVDKAVGLFEGDRRAAIEWLQTPQPALAGQKPLDFAQTDIGAREVEDLIGRLEHGIFT